MRGIAFDLMHKCITLVWEWWDKRVPLFPMGIEDWGAWIQQDGSAFDEWADFRQFFNEVVW